MTTRLIDLSYPISEETPPFPGDPPVSIEILDSTELPAEAGEKRNNISRVSMCLHCGTHMDAPFHFYGDGATIDQMPLEVGCGPALLIDLQGKLTDGVIRPEHLRPTEARIKTIRRVLIHTGWQSRWRKPEFFSEHPVISGEAAEYLVSLNILLVGIDFPSVDQPPYPAHLPILGAGVVILENLANLHALPTDEFELIALPLAIAGRDGSPVRAVARVAETAF